MAGIDIEGKMNLPLYYPTEPLDGRMSLIDVMMQGIEKSFKTAYQDDELQTPMTFAEIQREVRSNDRYLDQEKS